jgi:cell wall-associated NlpC family hydrolase
LPILPTLSRILKWGIKGKDVEALQTALNAQGFNAGKVDGDFGDDTEKAVRRFQQKAGLTVDGEVWTETWKALGGKTQAPASTSGNLQKLADFAEDEAKKQMSWINASSEAEQYLKIFRKPMQDLGQIGSAKVFYDWCGAFVYYCCKEAGIDVPIQPTGFYATLALVDSWKFWGEQQGFWYSKGSQVPKRGDIVVFDWDGDGEMNHIGIVRGYTPGADTINTSEGNKQNQSGNFTRSLSNVAGFIRIV